jgi:glycerate-2-kinase
MDNDKIRVKTYIDAGADLAESVKRNIQHNGIIDNETVLKLNDFIIAFNAVQDLLSETINDTNENDNTLN